MKTADDYRIRSIETAFKNGRKCIVFEALVKKNDGLGPDYFEFLGQFSAPIKTAKQDLWQIVAYGEVI